MDSIACFLKEHFGSAQDSAPYSEDLLREFLQLGPLHTFIPAELGGKCEHATSYLNVVELASYHSLPLGLTLGITGSLFLLPIVKHAQADLRARILDDFLHGPALGGMMITEPGGGTDIFGLQTGYRKGDETLTLNGTKCWGGLTGRAGHWLVAARAQRGDRLTKRLNLLYVPLAADGVDVREYFDALGLQPITYGETTYRDVELPASGLLAPDGWSGLRIIYDTLFRSRLGIPAISAGVCRRLLDESTARASERQSFGQALADYDQVQFRLSTLRGFHEINRGLRAFCGNWMNDHSDVSGDATLVNAVKVVSSETLQAASDSALQLFAAAAYKRQHLVGRAFVDARPFQIFEGSNDVLDENIITVMEARHGGCDWAAVEEELKGYGLAVEGEQIPQTVLNALDGSPIASQRLRVQTGRMIAWVFALAILRHHAPASDTGPADGRRLALGRMAALAAGLPYMDSPPGTA